VYNVRSSGYHAPGGHLLSEASVIAIFGRSKPCSLDLYEYQNRVSCADGCEGDLVVVRGFCRGLSEALCGMVGESCCGVEPGVPNYGPYCTEGLCLRRSFLEENQAWPGISNFTCYACGAEGQDPCKGESSICVGFQFKPLLSDAHLICCEARW
jgi:hypothetical protein